MEEKKPYRIAFIGWNPFQFIHIKRLASFIPSSVFIIEKKEDRLTEFSDDILNNADVPILIWEKKDMIKLDGLFDIIVAQTMFTHIHMFTQSKIVMLQYGYAKEVHNYGSWRGVSDLTLTFGEYATKKISHFCPAVSVGNPRYDVWHEKEFHELANKKYAYLLDKTKKTILYMPTWGDLSSLDIYFDSILKLSDKYNLLIKLHHNTAILEKNRVRIKNTKSIHFFGATDDALDLLSISDIVVSDYSGAIFDAIYCEKPLLLLDLPKGRLDEIEKIDNHSLEIATRDELGYRVESPSKVAGAILSIEKKYNKIVKEQDKIKNMLFLPGANSTQNAIDAMISLMEGKYSPSQMQAYIQETMHQFYVNKRALAILRKKKK